MLVEINGREPHHNGTPWSWHPVADRYFGQLFRDGYKAAIRYMDDADEAILMRFIFNQEIQDEGGRAEVLKAVCQCRANAGDRLRRVMRGEHRGRMSRVVDDLAAIQDLASIVLSLPLMRQDPRQIRIQGGLPDIRMEGRS